MCYGNTYKNKMLNLLNKISPTQKWRTILIWLISIRNNKKRKRKQSCFFVLFFFVLFFFFCNAFGPLEAQPWLKPLPCCFQQGNGKHPCRWGPQLWWSADGTLPGPHWSCSDHFLQLLSHPWTSEPWGGVCQRQCSQSWQDSHLVPLGFGAQLGTWELKPGQLGGKKEKAALEDAF